MVDTISDQKLNYIREMLANEYSMGGTGKSAINEEILHLIDWAVGNLSTVYRSLDRLEHPIYPKEDWSSAVSAGATEQGYWTWVTQKVSERHRFKSSCGKIEMQAL